MSQMSGEIEAHHLTRKMLRKLVTLNYILHTNGVFACYVITENSVLGVLMVGARLTNK